MREKLGNGIDVWGDPTDVWVAARRVWNQNAYHVTNVTEGSSIPQHEPESWKPYNGRLYNTHLSLAAAQLPESRRISRSRRSRSLSPDVACGQLSDTITITVEVRNLGDLRAGAGVPLDFYGTWGTKEQHLKDAAGDPLVYTLPNSIEAGGSVLVSVTFAPGNNGQTAALPKRVRVTVDGGNQAAGCTVCGAQRECNEGNNEDLTAQ